MECCPKQNKLEKHHSSSRAGTSMIPKEKENLALQPVVNSRNLGICSCRILKFATRFRNFSAFALRKDCICV